MIDIRGYLKYLMIVTNRLRCKKCFSSYGYDSFVLDMDGIRFRSKICRPESTLPVNFVKRKFGRKLTINHVDNVFSETVVHAVCPKCLDNRSSMITKVPRKLDS
jgi:hypothetical protein